MKREKLMLGITPDDKSALRATFHHFKQTTTLSNRLKTVNSKQKLTIYLDEYDEFERFLQSAINDKHRYPSKKGKEWESLNNMLARLRKSRYE